MHAGESWGTRAGEREGEMDPGSSRKSIVKINKWIPSSVLPRFQRLNLLFRTSPFSFRSFIGFKRHPHTSRRLCWRTDEAESKCVSRARETAIRRVERVKTSSVVLLYKVREIVPCTSGVFISLFLQFYIILFQVSNLDSLIDFWKSVERLFCVTGT